MFADDLPLWQLTAKEFIELLKQNKTEEKKESMPIKKGRNLVYGYEGLAKLLGISRSSAINLKNRGVLSGCFFRAGRKLVFDADEVINTLKNQRQ